MRVHLKPRAVNGPGNMVFLRELLSATVKKCFLSHAASWLNLPNVALRVHADDPPFPIASANERYVVGSKSCFFVESKKASVVYCERYIKKMSTVMEDKYVKEERSLSIADFDKKIRGYVIDDY